MSTAIQYGNGNIDKALFGLVIVAMGLLFVTLTQPAWRGEEMAAQFRTECAKRGGVMLTHKTLLGGTSYECASRLD